jgi:hypothetical protein
MRADGGVAVEAVESDPTIATVALSSRSRTPTWGKTNESRSVDGR